MKTAKQRIFFNTVGGYARSVISMLIGIFTGRWVLEALGAVDFGLFAVVGTLIAFVSFLNSVLAASASRHLAFAVGQARQEGGDSIELVQRWFNVALLIHTVLPLLLVVVGYPIGVYAVRNILTIPPERVSTCVWVFRLSLVTAFVGMMSVPYSALYVARQRIVERSMYDVCSSIARCALAFGLLYCPGDKLLIYACYMTAVSLLMIFVYRLRCLYIFPESHLRFSYMLDREKIRAIVGFASWNVLGVFGWMVKEQGLAVLANKFFGPVVNAAMGVAQQVSGHVNALSSAIMAALSPEIISTEGQGDRERVKRLVMSASRFAALLSLFFALPLCFEMEYMIGLWLKTPPEWSILFCRIILVGAFLSALSVGQEVSIKADGRIAGAEISASIVLLLSFPVAWIGCKLGLAPWIIMAASAMVFGLRTIVHVVWARRLMGLSVWLWVRTVLLPIAALVACVVGLLTVITLWMADGFVRLLVVGFVSSGTMLGLSVLFVLSRDERMFIFQRVQEKLGRKNRCG